MFAPDDEQAGLTAARFVNAPAAARIGTRGASAMTSVDFALPLPQLHETDLAAPHDFFEELADRLAEAAAEMGIGEG